MQKRRKVVQAGWYVGAGIAFLMFGLPPEWLNNTPTRALFCLLGVMCLGGAAYEWWFRKPDQSTTFTPSVQPAPLIPRLTALTPCVRQAYRDADGVVHLGRGPAETGMQIIMRYAILAPFKNTARTAVRTRNAKDVSASVIFKDADGSPITGAWIDSATHTVDIPMGGPEQCLILAFADEGSGAFMISDERSGLARKMTPISFCSYPKDGKPFHRDFAMRVELMEGGGHLALEAEYNVRITLPYPQVSLVGAAYPSAQAGPEPTETPSQHRQPESRSPLPVAVDMYRASMGVTRAMAKLESDMARLNLERPYVAPEFDLASGRLFIENVGVRPALEISIDPIGTDGISRMTFDPVPILTKASPKTEVKARFSGDANPQNILDVLHLFSTTTIVRAQRLAQTLRGQEEAVRVPLVIRYRDALADMTRIDTYEFVSKVPTDGRWVVWRKVDTPP